MNLKMLSVLLSVFLGATAAAAENPLRAECEQKIAQAICVTTADAGLISMRPDSISCNLNTTEAAAVLPSLMLIYDELPGVAQPVYCHLKKIFISDSIPSTAFAGALTTNGYQISHGYIGMRKATLTRQPIANDLTTWKEQLLFGGSSVFLSRDPSKVQMEYDLKLQHLKEDGLFYVVLHELGHVVDFFNGISMNRYCGNNCLKTSEDWTDLSWQSYRPLPQAAFYMQDRLCFYNCRRYIPDSEAAQMYNSLRNSAFITTYSGTGPTEDFAEFWSWYLLAKHKNAELRVILPGGEAIDMTPSFTQNGAIARKMKFVESLVQNPGLKLF